MEKPALEPDLSHFKDYPPFRFVRRVENEFVLIYERAYENLPHFLPMKNNTTGEIERCVIRLELSTELVQGKREIKIAVYRHFPSGTDYYAHDIEDINPDPDLSPMSGLHIDEEFYFENWSGLVYKRKGKKGFSISSLLEQLYQLHVMPCRKVAGFLYRKQKAFASKVPDFTEKAFPAIRTLLKVISGKKLEFDYSDPNSREEFLMEPIKYSRIKPIPELVIKTPFGYELAKPTALWSLLTILTSIYSLHKFGGIDKDSVLYSLIASIFFLVFLIFDYVIPLVLLFIMNWLIKYQYSFEPNVKV